MTRARFLQYLAGWALFFMALPLRAFSGVRVRPVNDMAPRFTVPEGATLPITPVKDFYVEDISGVPAKVKQGTAGWTLHISGQVQKPLTLSPEDFKQRKQVTRIITLSCIGNPVGGHAIGNAEWRGVLLSSLLKEAGVDDSAEWLTFHGADGYHETLPLSEAMKPSGLLATHMNGKPLTRDHGRPVRLLIPGLYGIKQVKWITRMEVTSDWRAGYWHEKGWSREARVQVFSRIDLPKSGEWFQRGEQEIRGIAFAGDRGIDRVEVSWDGGKTWQVAEMEKPLSPWSWVFWRKRVEFERGGRYTVMVRAADQYSRVQDNTRRDPFPAGTTGYHKVEFRVY